MLSHSDTVLLATVRTTPSSAYLGMAECCMGHCGSTARRSQRRRSGAPGWYMSDAAPENPRHMWPSIAWRSAKQPIGRSL
jgi:hypothetical protein